MGGTVRGFEGISTIAWNDACTAFVGNVGRMGAHAGKSFVLESIIQFSFVVTFILFLYKLRFSHDLGHVHILFCLHTHSAVFTTRKTRTFLQGELPW